MEDHEIKQLAQFAVVQHWTIYLLAATLAGTSKTLPELDEVLSRLPDALAHMPVGGVSPEWSDLLSAETEEAARQFGSTVLRRVQQMRQIPGAR